MSVRAVNRNFVLSRAVKDHVGLLLLIAALAALPVCAQPGLRGPVERIETEAGCVFTYEEPPRTILVPVRYTNPGRRSCREWLNGMVESWNAGHPALPFRVIEQGGMRHIVPARGAAVLDTVITIPRKPRSPSDILVAIAAAVSARSGVRIIGTTGLMRGLDGVYTGAKINSQWSMEWGIKNAPARVALTDFLARSKTTLIWRLLCNPEDPHLHADCVLGVMPLIREYTGSDGKVHRCIVTFDRGEPLEDGSPPPPAHKPDRRRPRHCR